jgi:large subunit ribosomal protein L6
MSRIGRLPIRFDPAVEVRLADDRVSVKGPKGQLQQALPPGITARLEERSLILTRRDDSKRQRALHGLARALLANAVRGVHQGFSRELEIHGVGYRADLSGKTLKLSLGFSHPVEFPLPEGIQVAVEERNTRIRVSGCDRQQVGQVAADIPALRPPDVYKQKGIRYAGEHLRKKAGKTGAK